MGSTRVGGTPGGLGQFLVGFVLAVAGGRPLLMAGSAIVFVGVIAGLQAHFRLAGLFNALAMLVLLFGGIGLIARSLRAQGG